MVVRLVLASLVCLLIGNSFGQSRKCPNLPVESENDRGDTWIGRWDYYSDNENTIYIGQDGSVDGGGFETGTQCEEIDIFKPVSSSSPFVWGRMIVKGSGCFGCLRIEQRTVNVLEIKKVGCNYGSLAEAREKCKEATADNLGKYLQLYRQDRKEVNCKNTFEGVYQFSYERLDYRIICDNPENKIIACQEPGSPFKDNYIFTMQFKTCPGNSASFDETKEWRCLGSWKDPNDPHKIYSAIIDIKGALFNTKVRCLLTRDNQQKLLNQKKFTMSSTPSCNELVDEFQGPYRFETVPAFNNSQVEELQPSCMLPQNFSGTWFTSSQYDSAVVINATHIHFNTEYTSFTYVETFFSCQQTRDTRYLMKQVTKGRCEVDYVCFEFLPRHQNIIRFRMGKPYRFTRLGNTRDNPAAMKYIFETACRWSAFTISRTENLKYVYQTFILHPPAPVECPIGGIYNFTQKGVQEFKYRTKIRGVTERPRVAFYCDQPESEFKVCSSNPKIINLDVERCASLDHVGRPIGEYDEPDNYLQCVGHWQENQQSYLVTYDTEDSVCPFRCWVYERLGWRDIRMSRALRAACGSNQTPRSFSESEGASLSLELHENEREFDDCPQKFLDGRDPYSKSTTVYVLGGASNNSLSDLLFSFVLLIVSMHSRLFH